MTTEAEARAQISVAFREKSGEASVKAGMVTMCSIAAAEYGGALWCGPAVEAGWKYLKPALDWAGGAFSDAIASIIPDNLRATGAYPWFADVDVNGNAVLHTMWRDACTSISEAWKAARKESGVDSPEIDAASILAKRLFAEGRYSIQYTTEEEQYSQCDYRGTGPGGGQHCVTKSRTNIVWLPSAKPWDRLPISAGLSDDWTDFGNRYVWTTEWIGNLTRDNGMSFRTTAVGGYDEWPEKPKQWQVFNAEQMAAVFVQETIIRPLQVEAALAIGQAAGDMAALKEGIDPNMVASMVHVLNDDDASSTSPLVTMAMVGGIGYGAWWLWKSGLWRRMWK